MIYLKPRLIQVGALILFAGVASTQNAKAEHKHKKLMEELISCGGKPVQSVTLYDQFSPTRAQKGGTCYAYAATATIEAALYRLDHKHRSFSPEQAALKGIPCTLDPHDYIRERLPELKKNLDPNNKTKSYLIDGGFSEAVLDGILKSPRLASPKDFQKVFELHEKLTLTAFKNNYPENCPRGSIKASDLSNRAQKLLTEDIEHTRTLCLDWADRRIPQEDFSAAVLRKKQIPIQHRIVEGADYGITPTDLLEGQGKCTLDDPGNQQSIRTIMRSLCAGIPISAALSVNNMEFTTNGGAKWVRYRSTHEAMHAMVLQGVHWRKGEPEFIFRDSSANGTVASPHASIARMPLNEICRIISMSVVLNQNDPDPTAEQSCTFSEDQKRIHCGTVRPARIPSSKQPDPVKH